MQANPFKLPGKFWRGNLHTHSTRSDGRKSVEDVCRIYREAGYDFLALTDHFLSNFNYPITDTRAYRTDDFTTIIGMEMHPMGTSLGQKWHLLALGIPLDFARPGASETAQAMVKRALETGAFVAAAHPYRNNISMEDILSLEGLHALEVFNGASMDHNERADSWYLFDLLLAHGHRYTACVGDDAHFKPNSRDVQLSWVWVKSQNLTPEAVLEGLKQGHYYSSTGPQIYDISVKGRTVTVRCSPAERIFLVGLTDQYQSTGGQGVTEATLNFNGKSSPYFRVIVRDHDGQMAWSNPMWFDEIAQDDTASA